MRIGIIDDHPLIRHGIKSVLELAIDQCEVVFFEQIDRFKSYLQRENWDLIIIDLYLKDESGFEVIHYLKKNNIQMKTIIFTSSTEYRDYKKAIMLGTDGYVLKDSVPEDLVYAIKSVQRGRFYGDPFFIELSDVNGNIYDYLTEREYEVFELIGKGYNNEEISKRLFISKNTVKKHVGQIFSKLDVTERTQVALLASEHFVGGRYNEKRSV